MPPLALSALFLSLAIAADVPSHAVHRAPDGVSFKGDLVMGRGWKDKEGEHVVLLSFLSKKNRRDRTESAYLYGGHWRKVEGAWQEVWRMRDRIEACEFDLRGEFERGSLEITDLDGDGIAEVSFLYWLGCSGDISPDTQKLLLYEGSRKHAMRGSEKVILSSDEGDEVMGGEYTADKAFAQAPRAFLAFARAQWAKLGVRKY